MTFLLPFLAWLMVLYSPAMESPSEVNSVRLGTNIVITENAYKSNNPVIPIKHQELIDCLSWYESRNNPEAVGKAGEIGILQFLPSTWELYCEGNIENPTHQRICADEMLKENIRNLRHWTTRHFCQIERN